MSPSEKRQHWISVIEDCKQSGQTVAKFCSEHRIALHCFYYWKKKLAGEQLPVAGFKEIEVPTSEGAGLWFDFGNGAKLMIDHEFNSSTFKKLMGVLSAC